MVRRRGPACSSSPRGRGERPFAGPGRQWAEWAAWHLGEAGYAVELDVWHWRAGDDFVKRMSTRRQATARRRSRLPAHRHVPTNAAEIAKAPRLEEEDIEPHTQVRRPQPPGSEEKTDRDGNRDGQRRRAPPRTVGPFDIVPGEALAEDTRFELVRGCPQHAFQVCLCRSGGRVASFTCVHVRPAPWISARPGTPPDEAVLV
ncbi:toll/interleukin-1 receptor domain-containing protein [Streptomyces glomeratus]|uniref:toll/interleukin-1 receptor domain-containing protein n=1 Tax=Streptomyces glomeratus TaxID=284452 RepID=UPI0031DA732B